MAQENVMTNAVADAGTKRSNAHQLEWGIGALARRAGVRPSAIRYYESAGILPPPKRSNGRRRYEPSALHRLRVLRVAQSAGLTMREIRVLFDGFAPEVLPATRWQALATTKLAELDALIARAHAMKAVFAHMLACACPSLDACGTNLCE